jgi:hypothetical protein
MPELNTLEDISEYLIANGFFYKKTGNTMKAYIKTGDSLDDVKELLPIQEIRLNEIVQGAVVNPLINMDYVNLKKLAISIDTQVIRKYKNKQAQINNNLNLQKKLRESEYVYIKDKKCYYKIDGTKLLIIDVDLIPKKKTINSFDNFRRVKEALLFEKTPNKYSDSYEKELAKFQSLSMSNWGESPE